MKLSICMMVKDEEKNIERCLKSIQPLRDMVDSELIIVDTGSTDSTVEICRHYTDRVYCHKWNNNFSDMRNVTINYAKGEWIFIIDADEELVENVDELVLFLKSKDSTRYNSASIKLCNILKLNPYEYSETGSLRFFRNDGYFKYSGAVHNQPIYREPVKSVKLLIKHYGYIDEDKEVLEKKFVRTSSILINELEKDPENVYYIYQLAASYYKHRDKYKAVELIKKAYKIINDKKLDKKKHIFMYTSMMVYFGALKMQDELIDICKDGIAVEKNFIDLYYALGETYFLKGKYIESRENFKKYIELVQKYKAGGLDYIPYIEFYLLDEIDKSYNFIIKIDMILNDYEDAYKYIKLSNEGDLDTSNIKDTIEILVKLKRYSEIAEYYNSVLKRNDLNLKNHFINILEENIKAADKIVGEHIYEALSEGEDSYNYLNKIRMSGKNEGTQQKAVLEHIKERIDFNNAVDVYGDIIYAALKCKYSVKDIVAGISEENMDIYMNYIKNSYDDSENIITGYINDSDNYIEDYSSIKTMKILTRYILLNSVLADHCFEIYFKSYIELGTKMIKLKYNSEFIKRESTIDVGCLEDKFFIDINNAYSSLDSSYDEYKRYIFKALSYLENMEAGKKYLLREIDRNAPEAVEMEQLKIRLKGIIKNLIIVCDYKNAKDIIHQYEEIAGDDEDIQFFKSEIMIKGN